MTADLPALPGSAAKASLRGRRLLPKEGRRPATIRLSEVIPWGRSFEEYRRKFALTDEDLAGRILASRGLGVDGAWSFLPRAVAHPLFP